MLRVDFSERHATLVDLARTCVDFDVQMDRLEVGDYCLDGRVVIERKTYADFATSLVDGRLFPQAAALASSLQGSPGIGPALASRLLLQFGSIERVVAADEDTLIQVRGVGRRKAAGIRELVR